MPPHESQRCAGVTFVIRAGKYRLGGREKSKMKLRLSPVGLDGGDNEIAIDDTFRALDSQTDTDEASAADADDKAVG